MEKETWREARKADTWEGRPRQKQLTLNEVAPKKVKDLYELNVAMSKKEGDFDHRYPEPVTKKNSSDDESGADGPRTMEAMKRNSHVTGKD